MSAPSKRTLTYSAKVPPSILTPDTVQTRIGTLKFSDGVPDQTTVQKVYDNLDFARGIEAFLSGLPASSAYAVCEGLESIGIKRNQGIGIGENLLDARSLVLTPNTTVVYVLISLDLTDGPMVVQVPRPVFLGRLTMPTSAGLTRLG